jgi:glycosyltransferase involved in cell wall biosynthesis
MIWDQGINYLLARGLEPLGVEVDCIHRAEFDPFGMTPAKWKRLYPYGKFDGRVYGAHVLVKSLGDYDLIHVHSFDKCVPTLAYLGKPILLHYHGSDIRGRWEDKRGKWKHANRIVVSTPDLLMGAPPKTEYLPNPIDTEVFKNLGGPRIGKALHFNYDAVDLAEHIAHENGVELTVMGKGVPYMDMPRILNEYHYYIDVKRDHSDRVLISRATDTGSLVGLQALACGCTVLRLDGVHKGLPPEHEPCHVAKKLYRIYKEMLE